MSANLLKKIKRGLLVAFKFPLFVLAIPFVLVMRLMRPFLLVRIGALRSDRIGHFAGNTEMFLCEKDAGIDSPSKPFLDLFYLGGSVCNEQLAKMWRRIIPVLPFWLLHPVVRVNRLIPGGALHEHNCYSHGGRDAYNLLDRFPPHLQFTDEEEKRGAFMLQEMGIPLGAPIVCLNVRDGAYLEAHLKEYDWSYHNYRDSDIQNYVFAAEELAGRGYYVIRMGAKVHKALQSDHPKVIDYATNGMRSDFMDIYLGAKCTFCISTGTGWDEIPHQFRRPIVYVNYVPIGYMCSSSSNLLTITKKHVSEVLQKELTLKEIFSYGVGFSGLASEFNSKGIKLVENTPEEIRNVAIEMIERLNLNWKVHEDEELLQMRFREIYLYMIREKEQGKVFHGEIRGRYGDAFLRNNRVWLQ